MENENIHILHNSPIQYIYKILGLKVNRIKNGHIECNKCVMGMMIKLYTINESKKYIFSYR